ncbi:MAG: hypothetical protein ACTSWW_04170 [Promethearchaeota archaeon]
MSTETETKPIEKKKKISLTLPYSEESDSNRLGWIDSARGFILVFLCLTVTDVLEDLAAAQEGSFLFFISQHPGVDATWMSLYDIGTPAFMFILGLSFVLSFKKRRVQKGTSAAVMRVLLRAGLLLFLGYFLMLVEHEFDFGVLLQYEAEAGFSIPKWDVLPALGLATLVALPFAFIKESKFRLIGAYVWMFLYQILLLTTDIRYYASLTYHGGIFGTFFTLSGVVIIASALGDYVFTTDHPPKKKYTNMALLGAGNLIGGILLALIPGWEPSKRISTLSFGLISIGFIILCCLIFVAMDEKLGWNLGYLKAFGRQPFFTYFMAEVLYQLPKEIIGLDQTGRWIVTGLIIIITSVVNMRMYKKKRYVPTEIAVLFFAGIGILFGIAVMFL